ncbi:hypothetical protein TNCV_2546251 [Trichonephila clavipes]|nr:hypothetical protein TNCV_2546251 [Trichonephila clavipes]
MSFASDLPPDQNIYSCISAPKLTKTEIGTGHLGPYGLLRLLLNEIHLSSDTNLWLQKPSGHGRELVPGILKLEFET